MENAELQNHESSPIPRWAGPVVGVAFSLAAARTIWQHGLRNWDWVQTAFLAMMGFAFALNSGTEQTGGRSWGLRIFWLLYGFFFGAWIGHEFGWWIPGGCFAVLSVIPEQGAAKRNWWHPLSLVANIALAVGLIWIVNKYGLWVPTSCLVAGVLLLRGTSDYRKSFTEYLKRPRVLVAMAIALAAVVWASGHPSFWSIVAPIIILILLFGDAWVYAAREKPLALPHPQS